MKVCLCAADEWGPGAVFVRMGAVLIPRFITPPIVLHMIVKKQKQVRERGEGDLWEGPKQKKKKDG